MTTSLINNNTTSSNSVNSGTSITGNSASETQDMFTKLLVAQIQNQDPLEPTDPSQFINQLTQLSQTESLQNMSTMTSNNTSVLQSMQVLSLGAQVGSDVMATSGSVTLDGSTTVSGQITLANSSSNTSLVLTDASGNDHPITLGIQKPGTVPFTIDPAALGLPAGSYTLSVTTSSNEASPDVDIAGRLNSVRLSSTGGVVLNVSNVGEVAPTSITAFNGKSAATSL